MSQPLILDLVQNSEITLNLGPSAASLELSVPTASGNKNIVIDTSANWAQRTEFVPKQGMIVIYSDRTVIDDVCYPGIKIGDGTTFVVDLPFLGDDQADVIINMLNAHVENADVHVTPEEKAFWNNKLNYTIDPLDSETLVFNRM